MTAKLVDARSGAIQHLLLALPRTGWEWPGCDVKLGMGWYCRSADSRRVVEMPDGEIFYDNHPWPQSGLMGPYGPMVSVEDRWAIVVVFPRTAMQPIGYVG